MRPSNLINCKWNWQRQRAFCLNLSQWERNGVQLLCLWLMHINTLLEPQGLGMGVWGLFRDCHMHTQLWLQTHVTHMWPKCKYYIYIFFKYALLFSHRLSHPDTQLHTYPCTLKHTLRVHYCWSGRVEECCVAKWRAEQNSTGDCINTQALRCARRGLFPFIHLLMSHFVQICVLENTLTL